MSLCLRQVAELVKKAQQLEVELDKTKELLTTTTQRLEEKEKALLASELEVSRDLYCGVTMYTHDTR